MTLHPRYIPDVPEETAKVAKAAFRKGNRYMQMHDELGTLFNDEQFADLFPNVGQVAESPWRLALVTVMQFCREPDGSAGSGCGARTHRLEICTESRTD